MFPCSEQINSKGKQNPIESISDPIVLERYVAIADYVKQKKNECSLKEGQTVEVVDKNQNGRDAAAIVVLCVHIPPSSGWWFVNLDDCNEGWVPATYLEPIYGTEEAQSEVLKPGEGMVWGRVSPGGCGVGSFCLVPIILDHISS